MLLLTSSRLLPSAPCACRSAVAVPPSSRRTLFSWFRKPAAASPKPAPLLAQDDLFHPLSTSPIPALRQRASRIKSLAP